MVFQFLHPSAPVISTCHGPAEMSQRGFWLYLADSSMSPNVHVR